MYEAMVYGTPFVTWPGRFMRSRVAMGAYHQMKIKDPPIADSVEGYAPLALSLGRDVDKRQALVKRSLEAQKFLFSDMLAVREFENFLHAALIAAKEGKRLPRGWQVASYRD